MSSFRLSIAIPTPWGIVELSTYPSQLLPINHYLRSKGDCYYCNAKEIEIKWQARKIIMWIDERYFNTLHTRINRSDMMDISKYIVQQHTDMKLSNSLYGVFEIKDMTIGSQGSISLYAHDFFKYLQKNARLNKLDSILAI